GDAHQPHAISSEYDVSVASPDAADCALTRLANHLRRTARDIDFRKVAAPVIGNETAIGRPEKWLSRARLAQRCSFQRIEPPDPDGRNSLNAGCGEGQHPSVGR